jgi:hypothetical protein
MGPAWASDFNFTGAETSVWELLAEGLRLPGWADGSAIDLYGFYKAPRRKSMQKCRTEQEILNEA